MTTVTLPVTMATVDVREVMTRVPITEVIGHYGVMGMLAQVHGMVRDEFLLTRISDERICDYLIRRGFNIEM